jgi:glucosyl-3-phosphoglycerate synthase
MVRTLPAPDFPVTRVAEAKRGRRVSLVIPARNEAVTVAGVVAVGVGLSGIIDEVVVVDDGSLDATAAVAREAGARVVSAGGVGKGGAMAVGLAATTGEVVVFADADVTSFDRRFLLGLVGPLLLHDDIALVKGSYERPGAGGRVNELVARPLLALLFPELARVHQPLGGEYAGRRAVLEAVSFEDGYGVDIGLLLDVAERHGTSSIAQVDLGVRAHRNRPLAELAPIAQAVMAVVFDRAGVSVGQSDLDHWRRLA